MLHENDHSIALALTILKNFYQLSRADIILRLFEGIGVEEGSPFLVVIAQWVVIDIPIPIRQTAMALVVLHGDSGGAIGPVPPVLPIQLLTSRALHSAVSRHKGLFISTALSDVVLDHRQVSDPGAGVAA